MPPQSTSRRRSISQGSLAVKYCCSIWPEIRGDLRPVSSAVARLLASGGRPPVAHGGEVRAFVIQCLGSVPAFPSHHLPWVARRKQAASPRHTNKEIDA